MFPTGGQSELSTLLECCSWANIVSLQDNSNHRTLKFYCSALGYDPTHLFLWMMLRLRIEMPLGRKYFLLGLPKNFHYSTCKTKGPIIGYMTLYVLKLVTLSKPHVFFLFSLYFTFSVHKCLVRTVYKWCAT